MDVRGEIIAANSCFLASGNLKKEKLMNSDARNESAPKLKKSKNLNLFKNKYFIICLAVVIIAIIVVIILTALNNKPADGGESSKAVESTDIYYNGSILTEADQEITKETLEHPRPNYNYNSFTRHGGGLWTSTPGSRKPSNGTYATVFVTMTVREPSPIHGK